MPRTLLRRIRDRYAGHMPIARHPETPIHPVPHLRELDRYVGRWVAVKDRRVVAWGGTSTDLALAVRALGAEGKGAVMQFVQPEADAYIVGVG
jgi:hypothetical protein